ncbi:VOC family protein, partial [Vibrio cholerae]|nr:VOC family protein [Vibrio cholerae]
MSSVVTALCGSFCIACLHPLTRRYVLSRKISK